jgi:hypothetical protein
VREKSRYSPSVRLSVRLYKTVLRAYPRSFRAAYGDEMLRVLCDCLRAAQRRRGTLGVVGLWAPLLLDTARNALAERAAEGQHMPKLSNLAWIRLGGAAAILGGLAQITYLMLATAVYFYPDWRELFLTYLHGWQVGPPLAILFVLALAALYARYTAQAARAPANQSPAARGLAASGIALAGTGLVLSTLASSGFAWGLGFSRICVSVTVCNAYDPSHVGMLYGVLLIVSDLLAVVGLTLFWIASRRTSVLPRGNWLLPLAGVAPLLSPLVALGAFSLLGHPDWDGIIKVQVVTAALGVLWALCWILIGVGLLLAQRTLELPRPQLAPAP